MAQEELVRRLGEYGLDSREAKTYIILARSGPKKAGELAKICEQSRIGIYRVLKRLQNMGLVETILSRPKQFAAVPPENAFVILIGAVKERISILENEKNDFLQLWTSLPVEPLEADEETFRVIWGRAEFFSAVKQMCASAKKQICILTTRNGLGRLYHAGVDDKLEETKGVEIRVLAEIDRSNLEASERFASIATLRHSKPTSAQFAVIDGSETVVNMALDDTANMNSARDTSLWTNSKGYTGLMKNMFDELWADSVDAKSAMEAIASGQRVPETLLMRDETKSLEKEAEIIRTAMNRILILMPSASIGRILKEPLGSALKESKDRGVSIRVMTNSDDDLIQDLINVSQGHDLRFVDFRARADTVSVDGIQTMLISRSAGEVAFWTSEKGYGELIQNFLEEIWSSGHDPRPYFFNMSTAKELEKLMTQIADEFTRRRWTVDTPGVVVGSSSVQYTFKVVARNQEEVITVDYLFDLTPLGADRMIAYAARKIDVNASRALLFLIPGADEQASKIAEFFDIEILQATTASDLLSEANKKLGFA